MIARHFYIVLLPRNNSLRFIKQLDYAILHRG